MLVHTGKLYGSDTNTIPRQDDPTLYHGPGVPWYVMLASGKFKYIRNLIDGETEELYDLDRDPDELNNLAMKKLYRWRLRKMRESAVEELVRTEAGLVNQLPSIKNRK